MESFACSVQKVLEPIRPRIRFLADDLVSAILAEARSILGTLGILWKNFSKPRESYNLMFLE